MTATIDIDTTVITAIDLAATIGVIDVMIDMTDETTGGIGATIAIAATETIEGMTTATGTTIETMIDGIIAGRKLRS